MASTPQVVILLGRYESSHLSPFVSPIQCRSLLTIRNRPILWYMIQSVKLQLPQSEIILGCMNDHLSSVVQFVESFRIEFPSHSTSILVVPTNENLSLPVDDNNEYDSGSLSALFAIKSYIKSDDFILLSGDSIGQWPLKSLIETHSNSSSLCSILLSQLTKPELEKPDNKKKIQSEVSQIPDDTVVVCLDQESHTLLSIRGFEEICHGESLIVPKSHLVSASTNQPLITSAVDLHCYMMNRQLIDFISPAATKHQLTSFRLDVLPLLSAFQHNVEELECDSNHELARASVNYSMVDLNPVNGLFRRILSVEQLRQFNIKFCSPKVDDIEELLGFTLLSNLTAFPKGIGKDVAIGVNTIIADDVVIKKSCIGSNCVIESGTRITASLIMDGVKIKTKSIIQQSIIGINVNINSSCELTECIIESNANILSGNHHQKEIISVQCDE